MSALSLVISGTWGAPAHSVAAPPPADEARGYARRPGVEPEDIALFVPRVILAVPRYALRFAFYPITQTLVFLDRHAIVEHVTDFLYNDARTAGVVPKLVFDSYFGATFGAKAFHENLAGHGEQASVEGLFGGRYRMAYELRFAADRFGGSRLWLESVTRYEVAPRLLFQGIGEPTAGALPSDDARLSPGEASVPSRFRQERLLALFRSGLTLGEPGRLAQIGVRGAYSRRRFGPTPSDDEDEPSTERVYATEELVGYADGVTTLETNLNLILDTRDVAGATSSGAYLELFAGGVPRVREYGYYHYGIEATGYFDLYRKTRVLALRLMLEGVSGRSESIPFSDLPRLGGPNRLRGYPLGRFRGQKAALGTVEYHYPIHQYVAGALYVDAGRVEQSYASFFSGNAWRAGFGGGFIVRSEKSLLFSVDIAYGEGVQVHVTTDPLRAFAKRDTEL